MPYLMKFYDGVNEVFGVSNDKNEETAIKGLFETFINEFADNEKADEDLAKIRSMSDLNEIKKFSFHIKGHNKNNAFRFLNIREIPMEDYAVFVKYGLRINFYE